MIIDKAINIQLKEMDVMYLCEVLDNALNLIDSGYFSTDFEIKEIQEFCLKIQEGISND